MAGERGRRSYIPAPLCEVTSLRLTPHGVIGIAADGELMDVQHRDHPESKWARNNSICVLFTHQNRLMQDRFGSHLTEGIAGENILIQTDRRIVLDDLKNGLVVETADGAWLLTDIVAAEPCVEYTRFAVVRSPMSLPTPPSSTR